LECSAVTRSVSHRDQFSHHPLAFGNRDEPIRFTRGLSLGLPRNVQVALVIRPHPAIHANVIERIAQGGGVFLAFVFNAEEAIDRMNSLEATARNQEVIKLVRARSAGGIENTR